MKKSYLPVLDHYTTEQLQAVIDNATTLMRSREANESRLAQAREAVKALMAEHGITADDIVSMTTKSDKKTGGETRTIAKVAIKYRNPANHQETWTGRGRTPTWLQAKIDAGQSRDAFLAVDAA